MPEEFEVPPRFARLRKVIQWPWKAYVWLRTRRASRAVANAIAGNQIAVAALAASVAAAGVGGYATYSAHQTADDVASLRAQVAEVQAGLYATDRALGKLESDVRKGNKLTAAELKAMGERTNDLAASLSDLAAVVSTLPTTAQTASLAGQITLLAADTQAGILEAHKAAQKAYDKADDDDDEEARAAALDARTAAAAAAQAAGEAAIVAEKAQRDALDALAKPGYTPPPAAPYTRDVDFADIATTINDGARQSSLSIDIPKGRYAVTYTAQADSDAVIYGTFQFWRTGQTPTNSKANVPAGEQVTFTYEFNHPGGVLAFNSWFNDPVTGRAEASIKVTSNLHLEKL